jgi:hypothetical protein
MSNRRLFLITAFASACAAALAGPGSSTGAGSPLLRARIPAPLANELLQEGLGQAGPAGTSRVHFDVKKTIVAEVKAAQIRSLSQVPSDYARDLFGLDLSRPFRIPIRVFGLSIDGDFFVRNASFSVPRDSDGEKLEVKVRLEIPRVEVSSSRVWAHEDGLIPESTPEAGTTCGSGTSGDAGLDAFAGRHVWAKVSDARIARRSKSAPGGSEEPLIADARFEARIVEDGADGRLVLAPKSVEIRNLERVLLTHYRFLRKDPATGRELTRLEIPKVRIWSVDINGVGHCRETDPSPSVKALFDTMLERLKIEIVKSVKDDIAKEAMKAAQTELGKLKLPAGKEFKREWREPPAPTHLRIEPTRIDKTYVRIQRPLLLSERLPDEVVETSASDALEEGPLNGVLWEISERMALGAFRVGSDGALELGLTESLRLNGHAQSALATGDEGKLPPQDPHQLRLVLNRAFFDQKADLVGSLRDEQARLLPKGIRLGEEGISFEARPDGGIGIVAPAELHLREFDGWKGIAGAFADFTGILKNGVLKAEARLAVRTRVASFDGARKLEISYELDEGLLNTSFREHPRLARIYDRISKVFPRLKTWIEGKVHEAAANLREHPLRIALAPLESKSPATVESVRFTDRGALVIDVSVHDFRPFIKGLKKNRKEAR